MIPSIRVGVWYRDIYNKYRTLSQVVKIALLNPSTANMICLCSILTNVCFFFFQQFEDALSQPNPNSIRKLVDPRLGDDYPLDCVLKVKNISQYQAKHEVFGPENVRLITRFCFSCWSYVADGRACTSMHPRGSQSPSNHEISCGWFDSSLFNDRQLGHCLLMWAWSSEPCIWKIGIAEISWISFPHVYLFVHF